MQDWIKQFYIGQENSGQFLNTYVEKGHTLCSYIVGSTISREGMLMLGGLPAGKFWKTNTPRLNLGAYQRLNYSYMCIDFK